MITRKPQLGDLVTCKEQVEAYGSKQAASPECFFEPGDTGIVCAIDCPAVTGSERTFSCVDFWKIGVHYNQDKGPWRCALFDDNIKIVERAKGIVEVEELQAYAEKVTAGSKPLDNIGEISFYITDLIKQKYKPLEILVRLHKLHGIVVHTHCPRIDSNIMHFHRFIRGLDPENDMGSKGSLNAQGFRLLK